MAWFAYLVGIVLMVSGIVGGGMLVFAFGMFVFAFGMLLHWKFWIISIFAGTIAFFVGAGWNKPSS